MTTSESPRTLDSAASLESVFAPVHSQTAFEEAVDRIGTAIRLGLLPPGTRLPAERELCAKLGIARSTLRQALVALGQSGHLHAVRGRGGGTFVVDELPPAPPPPSELIDRWPEMWDHRVAVEVGCAVLASRRARAGALSALGELLAAMEDATTDFGTYRQLDVRFHIGLAEATGNPRMVTMATEVQGEATRLIALIAHPPEVLNSSNMQHRRVLAAVASGDEGATAREMAEHLRGTEHVLAGLLPRI
ncbi:MAG TPA: FCD domain-containing protein [Solirubrobacteraceae bacterium]|nr:FCD domain-containing protein [Solirubrobacteraceae bacterium]